MINVNNMNLEEYVKFLDYECFLVFDPHIRRIDECDILLSGEEAVNLFHELYDITMRLEGLKYDVLNNKLRKIDQMIQQVVVFDKETIIMTKFMNKIWGKTKRYSDYADRFININLFLGVMPKTDMNQIISDRVTINEDASNEELEKIEKETTGG